MHNVILKRSLHGFSTIVACQQPLRNRKRIVEQPTRVRP